MADLLILTRIQTLWNSADRPSASVIAERLGFTTGKVKHLIREARRRGMRLERRENAAAVQTAILRGASTLPSLDLPPLELPVMSRRLRDEEQTCAYVIRLRCETGLETQFCGKPLVDHPVYCPEHREVCYVSKSGTHRDDDTGTPRGEIAA